MKLILIILLLSSAAFGQIISPSNIRTIKQFKNYIQNPDLEYNNEAGITDSSSIAVPVSGATTALNGTYSLNIDGTASGQKVKFKLNNLPNKFEPGDGEFSFIYKGTMGSSSGDYKAYIENNTGTKKSPEFVLYSTGPSRKPITGWFNGDDPIDNPYFLVIESTQSAPESFVIDDVYAGDITSIGQFSSISERTSYVPATAQQGFGNITITSTKDVAYTKFGKFVLIEARVQTGTTVASEARFDLPSGMVIDSTEVPNTRSANGKWFRDTATGSTNKQGVVLMTGGATYLQFGFDDYTTAQNPFTPKNGNDLWANSNFISFQAWVPIQGLSASTSAAAASQTDYGWTSFTPIFTGFGTVSSSNCQHSRSSEDLLLRCTFTAGTVSATEARVSFPNSLVSASSLPTLSIVGSHGDSATADSPGYVLIEPSVGYVTFGVSVAGSSAGLAKKNGSGIWSSSSTISFHARLPIAGWAPNQRAPTLIGSVTSDSAGPLRLESAIVATNGTVSAESSDWINGNCTNAAPRVCTFVSGTFSSTPLCFFATNTQGAVTALVYDTTLSSSTAISVREINSTTGAASQTQPFNILCFGSR